MSQKKILIIDDDPSFREVCSAILVQSNYLVDTAGDTIEGLEKLETERPDLLILDIMMTTVDEGIKFATSLRQREDLGKIPIMIVSARPNTEKGYRKTVEEDMDWIAADLFMEKPINPQDLLHNVRLLIEK